MARSRKSVEPRVLPEREEPPARERTSRPALRAAAYRIDLRDRKIAKREKARHQEWQDDAWDMFDDIGEIKYTMWWLGNAMSKLRIFAAVRPLDDPEAAPIPVTDPSSGISTALAQRAAAEIDRIRGPLGGRGEILRVWNMNLEIAGECYIVGIGATSKVETAPGGSLEIETITPESWDVRSIKELQVVGDRDYKLRDEPGGAQVTLDPDNDVVVRSYLRHPAWAKLADSNMRGVLTDCEALVLLTNEIKAESKSRQSAGLLLLPNGISTGGKSDTEPEDGEEAVDPFEEELQDALLEPIEDPSSAYSVYPLVARGERDDLKEVRHISLSRDTTTIIEGRINQRVTRIARGMNVPMEVVEGHANTTFSNAEQIDEDTFEDHLEPRARLIVDSWTIGLLQPALLDAGFNEDDVDRVFVWYSPSDLVAQIDPIDSVNFGVQQGLVSNEAWRRYRGFSEDDAPEDLELLITAILAQKRWDPGLVDTIVRRFDPSLVIPPPVQLEKPGQTPPPMPPPAETPPPDNAPAPASVQNLRLALLHLLIGARLQEGDTAEIVASRAGAILSSGQHVGRKLYEIDRELRTRLLIAADRAMMRALEKAGARLKTKGKTVQAILTRTHPAYAAQRLGPSHIADLGIHEADLIELSSFDSFGDSFRQWCAHAQRQSLDLVAKTVGLTSAQRAPLATRQAQDLASAWDWLRNQLHALALVRLYQPDPNEPPSGEFDPNAKVPAGLIRQALARAGGATTIEPVKRPVRAAASDAPWVAVTNDSKPLGGIGCGELVTSAMTDAGAAIEVYEWDYGPAFRLHPFDEHEALDGEVFASWDDDVLAAGDWIGDYYFPGDHDGCVCDFIPTYALPEDLASSQAAANGEEDTSAATTSGDTGDATPPEDDTATIGRKAKGK